MSGMRLRILGPLEAEHDGARLAVGPYKQRIVLSLLLCQANRPVSVATLYDALWEEALPRTAHKNIQVYVSALRKLLGEGGVQIVHSPPGYLLRVKPEQVDALHFHELARAGRTALRDGDAATAADLLGQAVRLWRGPVLPELASVRAIAVAARQLREQYLAAYEDWAEAMLALGRHLDLVEDIGELARRHPFRERLRHAQMLALHRAGRRTEALAQFDGLRQQLARDLGLPPSPVLERLYESMLAGDRSLGAGEGGAGPPGERKSLLRDVAHLTGRARQVRTLLDTLGAAGRGAVVVVSGPAGVGKTSLVVHCAHRLGDRFPDGRVLVHVRTDGQARPVVDVLGELLRGLEPGGGVPDGEPERAALLGRVTAGRQTLIILDDAAVEAQARAVLSAAEDSVTVVTSRRHLAGLAATAYLPLEPLPERDALELLGRLIGEDRLAAEPAMGRRIVAACGGLPLALRIVGAKLTGLAHLSLSRYADRLDDRRRLLDELVAGDLDMRSRLAVWYRDLCTRDRETLHRLAAADVTFTADEATRALGTDVVGAEAAIERLIQEHLVEARPDEVVAHDGGGGSAYRLPSLIRVFLRELTPVGDLGGGPVAQ